MTKTVSCCVALPVAAVWIHFSCLYVASFSIASHHPLFQGNRIHQHSSAVELYPLEIMSNTSPFFYNSQSIPHVLMRRSTTNTHSQCFSREPRRDPNRRRVQDDYDYDSDYDDLIDRDNQQVIPIGQSWQSDSFVPQRLGIRERTGMDRPEWLNQQRIAVPSPEIAPKSSNIFHQAEEDDDEEEGEEQQQYMKTRDDDYDDAEVNNYSEYEENDIPPVPPKEIGNYWSNPVNRPDSGLPPVRKRRPQYGQSRRNQPPNNAYASAETSVRRPRRTSFASSTSRPPKPLADLYHRLFWYGLDDSEMNHGSQADPTMFGGTKGKFNGLDYLYNGEATVPIQERRRLQPRRQRRRDMDEEEYYANDDLEYYGIDEKRVDSPTNNQRWYNETPPEDRPQPRGPDVPFGRARRYGATVDVWWNDNDEEEEDYDRRPLRPSVLTDVLDSFLGLDRDRLQQQAQDYNQRVLRRRNNPNDTNDASLRRQENRGRARVDEKGELFRDDEYTTKMNNNQKEDKREVPVDRYRDEQFLNVSDRLDVIDAEPVLLQNDFPDLKEPSPSNGDENMNTVQSDQQTQPDHLYLTWEERALAVERVPPANIPAWSPSGELDVDARTKAWQDAVEDIRIAQDNVRQRQEQVEIAREDIAIRQVDAALEARRRDLTNDQIRATKRRIQDSRHRLEWQQILLEEAQREIMAVEGRHWAVLRSFNPDTAEEALREALAELENIEPAVRRHQEKVKTRLEPPNAVNQ